MSKLFIEYGCRLSNILFIYILHHILYHLDFLDLLGKPIVKSIENTTMYIYIKWTLTKKNVYPHLEVVV